MQSDEDIHEECEAEIAYWKSMSRKTEDYLRAARHRLAELTHDIEGRRRPEK